jgi:YVTN family beta-propeller protein
LVVTADWLNRSLTLLDYARLVDGRSSAPEAILRTVDLSEYAPGPIEVELTPDGETAVVSVGPAFFDSLPGLVGDPDIAAGGTLLVIDLPTGDVEEVQTQDVPLGIAVSPDGRFAYTANYGTAEDRGDSLSVIDLDERRVVAEVVVGEGPEQVALSPDGTLGIINVVSAGGVRVFRTADIAATLSEVVQTGRDPSDVSFLAGNDRAIVANSQGFDLTLLDTSDPANPFVLDSAPLGIGIPYGVTYVPSRDEVLATSSAPSPDLPTNRVTVTARDDALVVGSPVRLDGENFLLAAAVDSEGSFAFFAHIVDQQLSIVDLETGETRSIAWLQSPGPSYVAVQH